MVKFKDVPVGVKFVYQGQTTGFIFQKVHEEYAYFCDPDVPEIAHGVAIGFGKEDEVGILGEQ